MIFCFVVIVSAVIDFCLLVHCYVKKHSINYRTVILVLLSRSVGNVDSFPVTSICLWRSFAAPCIYFANVIVILLIFSV